MFATSVYSPYGHHGSALYPSFSGERYDPCSRTYLLGQGFRGYSPALMRFLAVDSLSPFGRGGLNAYAYCAGDPVNFVDPTAKTPQKSALLKSIQQEIKYRRHRKNQRTPAPTSQAKRPKSQAPSPPPQKQVKSAKKVTFNLQVDYAPNEVGYATNSDAATLASNIFNERRERLLMAERTHIVIEQLQRKLQYFTSNQPILNRFYLRDYRLFVKNMEEALETSIKALKDISETIRLSVR